MNDEVSLRPNHVEKHGVGLQGPGVLPQRSVVCNTDPNPVMDGGAPRSNSGMQSATLLCEFMSVEYTVTPPNEEYYQGWGQACSNPRLVRCSWEVATLDSGSQPVSMNLT